MDATQFLAEFKHIASAPNGVDQLRQLVMGLALAGKLLMSNESLPEDFAIQVEAAKQKYFDDLGRRVKPFLFGEPLIKEFRIPVGWRWVRVGEVCDLQTGATPSTRRPEFFGGEIKWLVSGDINREEIYDCEGRITHEGLKNSNCKILPPNCVLIALNGQGKTRASVAILRVSAACNQSLVAIIPFSQTLLDPKYLHLSLRYRYYEIRDITGQKQRRGLNMALVSELSIPLAPVEEQKRIVAKVDELMGLCDKLEALQQQRKPLCKLARITALNALTSADTAECLNKAWVRIQSGMKLLLDTPESVEDFRDAIIKSAVWGRLTKRTGEDARTLLEHCRTHKESLIAEGLIRREKPLKRIEALPTRLPENWAWARFSEIGMFARGKSKHRPRNDPMLFSGGKYPFVQTGDVANSVGKGITTFSKSYNDTGLKQSQLWPKGTLCITIAANIAESAILKIDACFPDSIVGFLPFEMVGSVEYFDLFMRTTKQELVRYAPSTAQKNINLGILEQVVVPLPPKEEMDDIIMTADKLLRRCEHLQDELAMAQDVGRALVTSIVSAITGIRIEEKEKMKLPKTELVSNLRIGDSSPTNKAQAPLTAILIKNNGELSAKVLWGTSGLEIDAFYLQLKTEMANGWIVQPEVAYMEVVEAS